MENTHKLILHCAGLSDDIDELKQFLTDLGDGQGNASPAFIKRNVAYRIIGCPWGNLHGYVYSNLTPDQRRYVYSSRYEPGHPDHEIPSDSETALFDYLHKNYGGCAEDLCKDIKADIKRLSGHSFETLINRDRNIAYRVLTLFYRLHRFRPKLRTLLQSDSDKECCFEFRHEFPMQEPRAMENSALLSEILNRLSFMMPATEQSQSLRVADTLSATQSFVADDFMAQYRHGIRELGLSETASFNWVSNNIRKWAKSLPAIDNTQPEPRLDVLLNLKLHTKLFNQRIKSNKLIIDRVLAYPLDLNPYASATWANASESDCLSYLTKAAKPLRIKATLAQQARFVESLVVYPQSNIRPSEPLSMIINAVILHDAKLKISVPSLVTGTCLSNIEQSPMGLLKKATREAKATEAIVTMDPNRSPEGLGNYWYSRVMLAICQQNNGQEAGRLQFAHKSELENQVCHAISDYLEQGGVAAYRHLFELYAEQE